jgi:hypothetical protein
MTSTELKAEIDLVITDETTPTSITPTDVGDTLKSMVDYVDQEVGLQYIAKLSQSSTSNVTGVVVKNTTGKTFTFTRNSVGNYSINFSSLYADLDKVDIIVNLQNPSYAVPNVTIDNLGILAIFETKYWNGTTFALSDDIVQNATIYVNVKP